MTSAGCARGITISGALGTVRAHGEYNYRFGFEVIYQILIRPETLPYFDNKVTTSVEYDTAVYVLQTDYLWLYMELHERLFETKIEHAFDDETPTP